MLISVNGFKVLPNINIYIITIFFLCSFIPVSKLPLWVITISLQFLFFIKLLSFQDQINSIVIFQVNSTVAVIVSLLFHHVFYNYRRKEFQNISKIKEQETTLKALFEMNPFPLLISRMKDGKVIMFNRELEETYGLNTLEDITDEFFFFNHQERLKIIDILSNSGKLKNYIIEGKTKNNKKKWILMNAQLLNLGGHECVLSGSLDITKLKEIESELKTKAYIDPLTKVLNREKGKELLERLYSNIKKYKGKMTLCFIDIDNLKDVNDTFGHKEGDILIQKIAKTIDSQLEQGDIFYRYAGDEFVLAFRNKNKRESEKILQNVQHKLENENKREYNLAFSYGMFEYSGSKLPLNTLIKMADKEMYDRKKSRKK